MTLTLEADIGYLSETNGQHYNVKPDCFLDAVAAGRIGRGRERDRLLLQMHFQSGVPGSSGLEKLLYLAHRHYYGTPGSVTAAARAAINAVNGRLLESNLGGGPSLQAGITCAVIRASELYVTQAGPGKTLVLRQKSAEQFPERKRLLRPLGMADKTEVYYFHTMLAKGDLLWMGRLWPVDEELTSLRVSGNGDWHESLAELIKMASANSPALLCAFCSPGEKGQLAAALAASAQVAAVVENNGGAGSISEPERLLNQPIPQTEKLVVAIDDPLGFPERYREQAPVLKRDEHVVLERAPESASRESNFPQVRLLDREHGVAEAARPEAPDPSVDASLDFGSEHPVFVSAEPEKIATASIALERAAETVKASLSEVEGLSANVLKPMMISAEARVDPQKRGRDRKQKKIMRTQKSKPVVAPIEPALERVRQWYSGLPLPEFQRQIEAGVASLQRSLHGVTQKWLARVLPGPEAEVQLPKSALLWFAAGVPVIVVLLTFAAYIQFGRSREFNYYLDEARAVATVARAAPDAAQWVPHWRQVLLWTDQAEGVRRNHPEVAALQQAARGMLDSADRVERVRVEAITADGFRTDANLVKILARGPSLYALDEANQAVYRAVLTTSGAYQLDPVFECRRGPVGMQSIEALVDITWLSIPNVVGQDTLLVLDPGGRLLYCTTDGVAAATVLIPPYDGWSQPVAFEAFQNRIYVLEPDANEIWVYEREDKFFANPPERYFSESAIDLSTAIDISIVQGTVFILHRDGYMTQCVRIEQGAAPQCTIETRYSDGRPGRSDDTRFDGVAAPAAMAAYPPPHSSLYLTDYDSSGAYQFSLRLAYQREFRPVDENREVRATSFAVGSGRDLFFASGNNVYVGRRP